MHFRVYPLELHFQALEPIQFPALASNTFRGALGMLLRGLSEEHYDRLFSPSASRGPSGLANSPRPFVIRAEALNGRSLVANDLFTLRVPLFTNGVKEICEAFSLWKRAQLVSVTGVEALSLPLDQPFELFSTLQVQFLTPTELKAADGLAARPDFSILAARVRDRVSTLSALYGEGPLSLDFQAFGERAASIRMTGCDLAHEATERRSTRTGQHHGLNGFTGTAYYEGDLTEFVPLLKIAEWTGVGRQTGWGKGALKIRT